MADRKISDLTALTTPASGDYLPIVDISEASAANKNKRITIEELLRGAPDGTAGAPGIGFESDPNTGIYSPGADALGLVTAGTERARIDSSGRLLVGASSARSNLFNGTVSSQFQVEGTSTTGRIISLISSSSSGGEPPFIVLGKQNSGTVGGNTAVASGDNVGIISFQGNDGTEFVEAARVSCEVDGTPGANDMPGRLVFSTTADGASSPTERMRLNSNGYFYHLGPDFAATFQTAAGAGTTYALITGGHTATSINSVPNACFRVWSNGDVVNTNNSYTAISDIKLKENIVDANSQWSDIKALRPVNYNFKEGQTHTQIGLIAQEVELVSPGLVSESPDRDSEGNDLGTVTKSVNYSVLYMKAVKALQEAMERIETLEAKVAALEGA